MRVRSSSHSHDRPKTLGSCLLFLAGTLALGQGGACSSPSGDGDDGASSPSAGGATMTSTSSSSSTGTPTTGAPGTTTGTSTTDTTTGTSTTGAGGATSSTTTGTTNTTGTTTGAGGTGGGGTGGGSWEGCNEFELPGDCTIPEGAVLPGELRCTGLYSNWDERTLRCGVQAYAPAYQLWSDGAGKARYVWLPPGSTIDVSDPDDWDYPVGTRFWKEFYVGPEGNQKLGETRYLLRADVGWLYTAYVWNEDGTAAIQENEGVDDLFGTGHSVPSREQCKTCHNGREEFILGFDFIMLGPGATGVTAQTLADADQFSGLDEAYLAVTAPGDEVEQAALTYLHANCGVSCHNTTLDATANPSGLYLRLELDALDSVLDTGAAGGINHLPGPNAMFSDLPDQPADGYYDIRPLDPDRSLLLARMMFRGSESAMPPLGTHVAHQEGIDLVRAWIESMTEERGYPAAAE